MRVFSILLFLLSISWHWFQSFPSSVSPICSHQPANAMVTFPLNATASLPPPETFSFTILDCSASRFQHILNLTAYFQHEKQSHTQISVPPTSSSLKFFLRLQFSIAVFQTQMLLMLFVSVLLVDNIV